MRRLFEGKREKRILIGLMALTLLVFLPFVGNAFVGLDDDYLIYNNPTVQHFTLGGFKHVFTSYDPQLYIPLTFVSYQINAAMFGINATAFHMVNLLLHCANVAFVFLILRRLTGKPFVAAFTAALFAVHPLQTEAVLWAAGRKDLLSGLFFLLSTFFYLRYRDADWHKRNLWWSIVFYALGLLSKVSIILLPVWLVMIDWVQKREADKRILTEKIPYGALALLFGIIAVVGKSRVLQSSGNLLNILLPLRSATFYLEKIAWPSGLSVIYPYTGDGAHLAADFGFSVACVLVLILLFGFCLVRKCRLPAFGLATYFVLLAPSFTTFWKNGFLYFASDRYAYLASIGIFFLIALALQYLWTMMNKRRAADLIIGIMGGVLIVSMIPLTRFQASVWANTDALYRNTLQNYPDSVMAHTNLGLELQHAKNFVEAQDHYKRAIELDPHSVNAYFNLSSLYAEEGKSEEAKMVTLRILDAIAADRIVSPADLQPLLWLVGKLDRLGRPDEAVRLLKKLVEIVPQFPEPKQMLEQRPENT
ncbi:tetratricopeptide repeat protein [Candidatus Peribacteria bacterium]|nr:tetratricopeptide repeat protein [Candidatus Peribacteria bacterium]